MATRSTRSRATVRSGPKPLSRSIPAEAGGSSLNQALGGVVLRESGTGVAGLVVTVYDVNRHPPGREETNGDRLGSVITAADGSFAFTFDDGSFHAGAGGRRPDLLILVSPPEPGDPALGAQAPPVRSAIRRAAGRVESFSIRVDTTWAAGAGLLPAGGTGDEAQREALTRAGETRRLRFCAETRQRYAKALRAARRLHGEADEKFQAFMSRLSSAAPAHPKAPPSRVVPRGGDILSANGQAIRAGIRQANRTIRSGRIPLTEEQAAQFRDAAGAFLKEIPGDSITTLLLPSGTTSLFRHDPLSLVCQDAQPPGNDCLSLLTGHGDGMAGSETADPDHHLPPEQASGPAVVPFGPEGVTTEDVPRLMAVLTQTLSSPESPVNAMTVGRANALDVETRVNGLTLHSGPADVPALHDFHHLQIAFEHVWQELFDNDVVQQGKGLYRTLVELGEDPNEYFVDVTDQAEIAAWVKDMDAQAKTASATDKPAPDPPSEVLRAFEISTEQWAALDASSREALRECATKVLTLTAAFESGDSGQEYFLPQNTSWMAWKRENINNARRQGHNIIAFASKKADAPTEFDKFHELLEALRKSLLEPYRFSIFAANRLHRSVNFGLLTTYRQRWTPTAYQVGELVKTVPLAPKEVRRFSKKTTVRQSRAEREVRNHLQARRAEQKETVRAETKIVENALNKTNFQIGAKGGISIGIASVSGTTSAAQQASTSSQEAKSEFHEAVFKAAEEYKLDRTLEINFSASQETTEEESGEISNPNDEIPVTYLFYELQRRYLVSEQIHRQTPVVLVAQECPRPDEIDMSFVATHEWILRRVLLDDLYLGAIDSISAVVGQEHALQVQFELLQQIRRAHEDTKEELIAIGQRKGQRYAALERSVERRAEAIQADENEGLLEEAWETGWGGSDPSPEAMRVRENAARDAYEREAKEEKEVKARLERETTALNAATEAYGKQLSDHLNRREQISRLLAHIKANILYYMQGIWSHEPLDQRFFRLHEVRVPVLKGSLTYSLEEDADAVPGPPDWTVKPLKVVVKSSIGGEELQYESLEEAADLDTLLGFKGNYMIFPLRKPNDLITAMMVPYLDPVLGLRDPDEAGNWTLTGFANYVCCLKEHLSQKELEKRLPGLAAMYQRIMASPNADGEEIIVPTGSLFIEALPGVHPILEDFKLLHRGVDVKKAQAEVRMAELENIRAVARLLAGEREDPTIEKKVVVEGGQSIVLGSNDA